MRAVNPMEQLVLAIAVSIFVGADTAGQTRVERERQWRAVLQESAPPPRQAAAREALARRQAQAAIDLYRSGQVDAMWPLLRHDPDPTRRSFLVRDLGRSGAAATPIVRRLTEETDVSALRALILLLGEFDTSTFPVDLRVLARTRLLELYRTAADPGVHSAVDWLLRHDRQGLAERRLAWGMREDLEALDRELATSPPVATRGWLIAAEGHTLALVRGPAEFTMGSPDFETYRPKGPEEAQVRVRIPRSFAVATKEVTVAQFQRFLDANPEVRRVAQWNPSRDPSRGSSTLRKASPDDESPQVSMTWFEAAQYCNWLSEQDGLPENEWVYPSIKDVKEGMELAPGHLDRIGYRLPTDAEWEFAARAGATATRFFGTSEELLREYAWYAGNTFAERSWPVGQLKPNDLGLFDVYGNVWEWIHDLAKPNGQSDVTAVRVDGEDVSRIVSAEHPRPRRGGSYSYDASYLRSAHRGAYIPDERRDSVGFRVARTVR